MYSQTDPQEVSLPEIGIRFTIPQNWTGRQDGAYIYLGHQSIPGAIILSRNTSENAQQLRDLAMQAIVEEGSYLQPTSEASIISEKQVEQNYEGIYQGTAVKAFAVAIIDGHGNGMTTLILTETSKFTELHISEAKRLATTITFFTPEIPDETDFWKNRIVGTQLKFMYTNTSTDYSGGYSGISDVIKINLCSNGQFSYYSNSHASFDGSGGFGYANENENNRGAYRIYADGAQTVLELVFNNQKTIRYVLKVNSEQHTLLNGTRYFVTTIEGCQ